MEVKKADWGAKYVGESAHNSGIGSWEKTKVEEKADCEVKYVRESVDQRGRAEQGKAKVEENMIDSQPMIMEPRSTPLANPVYYFAETNAVWQNTKEYDFLLSIQ